MEIRHNSENKEADSNPNKEHLDGKLIPFPKKLPVSSSKIKVLFQTVFQGENKSGN
ncbi:MAG: hypothetical protein GW938_09490 [Leptospira sp.]|nr:hypothetical protein [Leptospira sp.]NCS92230.1 hypothetical protein [Leptospira sp.]